MEERERAYIAGLFDGEGDVGVFRYRAKKNGRFYLRAQVRITNTNRRVLEWVKAVVGAGLIVTHDRGERQKNRKPCFRWILANSRAVAFLTEILPYLHIKTEKVTEVLTGPHSGRAAVEDRRPPRNGG